MSQLLSLIHFTMQSPVGLIRFFFYEVILPELIIQN